MLEYKKIKESVLLAESVGETKWAYCKCQNSQVTYELRNVYDAKQENVLRTAWFCTWCDREE